jgi:transposase
MPQPLSIEIKESIPELRRLQRQHPSKFKALQMLILLRQQGPLSKDRLALLTGASDRSVHVWRNKYIQGGIEEVLKEGRGGNRLAAINIEVYQKLETRLQDPRGGFRSFVEIQQWLQQEFGLEMKYQALNKYVKRHFNARPKVSRKSHVQKDPAAEAVFKKPV